MPSGLGITNEQREYILKNRKDKFIKQIACELGLSLRAVRNIVNK